MYLHLTGRNFLRLGASVLMDVDASNMKKTEKAVVARQAVRLPCACANLRRAARVMTRLYDAALRPSGLGVAQFTLLQALTIGPGMSQKQLAGLLEIDSTTLTRTLAPLRHEGWLRSTAGDDRRELRLA